MAALRTQVDRVRCADCANAHITPRTQGENWRCTNGQAVRGRVYLGGTTQEVRPDATNPDGFRLLLRKQRHCEQFASMDGP